VTPTDLIARKGLPDELRILADRYPREAWRGHANFNGLTAFWLDRHAMFRALLERLRAETGGFAEQGLEARTYAMRLHRFAGMLIGDLHGHHSIEDQHYFPLLAAREPRLQRGFELLDADHHQLHEELDRLTGDTNAVLGAIQAALAGQEEARRLGDTLARFETFLDRHLSDEEDLIVPIILEHRFEE
jgi:iron-sulfur cluster repair protein YtfE (RIC family)